MRFSLILAKSDSFFLLLGLLNSPAIRPSPLDFSEFNGYKYSSLGEAASYTRYLQSLSLLCAEPIAERPRSSLLLIPVTTLANLISIPATTLNLDRLPTTLARLASAQAICKECARLASAQAICKECARLASLSRDARKDPHGPW